MSKHLLCPFVTSVLHSSSCSSPSKALWSQVWMLFCSFYILFFSDRRVNLGSSLSAKPLPGLPDLSVVYLQKDWPAAPSQDPADWDTNGPFRLIYRAYSGPGTQGDAWVNRTVLTSLITRTTWKSHLMREKRVNVHLDQLPSDAFEITMTMTVRIIKDIFAKSHASWQLKSKTWH